MSYASGMAIGLTVGQQLLSFFTKNDSSNKMAFNFQELDHSMNMINKHVEEGSMHLASALKGRRRYYIDLLKYNANLSQLLITKLSQIPYIKKIDINIHTGSLLVIYNCTEEKIDELFKILKQRVFKLGTKIKQFSHHTSTMLAETVVGFTKEINDFIKLQTNNFMDLSIVVALFFIIRGIRKVLSMGQRPSGPQMLWWAFSILKGLGI